MSAEEKIITQLWLIGCGTPTPTPERFGSCLVLQVDDVLLMFDCGPATTYSVYFEFYFRGRMVRYRYPGLVFLVVSHVECLPHIFSNLTAQALYSAVMVMLSKAALVSQLAHASRK